MAPEQAKGKAVDKRADVWAFGVVLYEMLTGERPFKGEDVSDTLAAVLRQEISLSALPATTPPRLRRLIGRCLERDPKQRLRDIGEARIELARIEAGGADVMETTAAAVAAPPPAVAMRRRILAAAGATLLVGLAIAVTWALTRSAPLAAVTRTSMLPPPGVTIYPDSPAIAISPDGKMVAFVVGGYHIPSALWVRSLDSLTARPLEGTDTASLPFWSPDSSRIAFFSRGGELKAVAVAGGRPETICNLPASTVGRGGSWNEANVIVFAAGTNEPIYRVSANRGVATPVTTLDAARHQSGHRFPVFLPDGDRFLYAALPPGEGKFDIFAGSLSGGTSTLIGAMESGPVYANPGWLLYARQGVLAAQPFDARALRVTGAAVSLADEPTSRLDALQSFTAGPSTSVSRSGALAYFSAPAANMTATWIEPTGRIADTVKLPAGQYSDVSISPHGTHAVFVRSVSLTEASLWLVDLANQGAVRISSGRGRNESPVWSPDGTSVVFASDRDGPQDFFVKNVADQAPEQPLYHSPVLFKKPDAWSRDDRIVFSELGPDTTYDLWVLPMSRSAVTGPPVAYLRGPGKDYLGVPSPDGHRLAYVSSDTGRDELYVQTFPEPGQKKQISTDGVSARWWSSDSRRLWFVGGDRTLWRADVEPGATLRVSAPVRLGQFPPNIIAVDASPDRQRFLALIAGAGSVTVVHNWRAALEKKKGTRAP